MKIDFEKMGGLVPAIIQDAMTKNVLMLGFMNEDAYQKTVETGHVTFGVVLVRHYGQKERPQDISLIWLI